LIVTLDPIEQSGDLSAELLICLVKALCNRH